MNNFSSIKKIDDNTFQITEHNTSDYQFGIKLKYSSILFGVIICIVIANIWSSYKHSSDDVEDVYNIINESKKNSIEVEYTFPFSDEGFVLPNSSKSYLTVEDLNTLNSKAEETGYSYSLLLRYAVNEIYARNGYIFKEQELDEFYSKYQWYEELHKVVEVPWEKMNEYEQSNLTLLLHEEKQ